eukprot:11213742-Lingulodinium_polyedra.AAC.1
MGPFGARAARRLRGLSWTAAASWLKEPPRAKHASAQACGVSSGRDSGPGSGRWVSSGGTGRGSG